MIGVIMLKRIRTAIQLHTACRKQYWNDWIYRMYRVMRC